MLRQFDHSRLSVDEQHQSAQLRGVLYKALFWEASQKERSGGVLTRSTRLYLLFVKIPQRKANLHVLSGLKPPWAQRKQTNCHPTPSHFSEPYNIHTAPPRPCARATCSRSALLASLCSRSMRIITAWFCLSSSRVCSICSWVWRSLPSDSSAFLRKYTCTLEIRRATLTATRRETFVHQNFHALFRNRIST